VVALLEGLGHVAIAPDLPGHGVDFTPVAALSLQLYAHRVTAALDAAAEPAVLVGHSLGGMVISQAAEDRPERVQKLVYLSAFLPRDGQSLAELSLGDTGNLLTPNSVPDDQGATIVLRDEGLRRALYADCRDEDLALARALLRPEPLAPLREPARLTAERFGALPRYYIECLDDRALPLPRQRLMHAGQPCLAVFSLACGHSPFFSTPGPLVKYLARLAASES
jgi:pimeloyl-ACP methyl ester carboxylesterase